MGYKVGITTLKLGNEKSKGKKTGNSKAVMCEALDERWSKDEEIDRSKTPLNTYEGIHSGLELMQTIDNEVKALSEQLKENGNRGIRKDATTGFAMIVKPEKAFIDSLTEEQKDKFFSDSIEILTEMLGNKPNGERNTMAIVRHKDEMVDHLHLFGMPYKNGKLDGKSFFNLAFYSKLNNEYPQKMRQKGWNLDNCTDKNSYDTEKAKTLNNQELKEYKEQCLEYKKSKKKKNGLESKKYREEQEKAKIEALEASKRKEIQEAQQQRQQLINLKAKGDSWIEKIKSKDIELANKEADIEAKNEISKDRLQEASQLLVDARRIHETLVRNSEDYNNTKPISAARLNEDALKKRESTNIRLNEALLGSYRESDSKEEYLP